MINLPPVKQGIPDTLVIKYKDGLLLRIPYMDYKAAQAFLKLEDVYEDVWVEPYNGT